MRTVVLRLVTIAAALLLAGVSGARDAGTDRHLLERARLLDESGQQPAEAIRLYLDVIRTAGENPATAAMAQYRIAVLYERMGRRKESLQAFQLVVSRYGDQALWARRAAARLSAAGSAADTNAPPLLEAVAAPADAWYDTALVLRTSQFLSRPVVDPQRHRLYIVLHDYHEPRSEEERAEIARIGRRYIFEPSTLIVLDTDDREVVRTLRLPAYVSDLAFNPSTGKLYLAAQQESHLVVVDTRTYSWTRLPVPGLPSHLSVNTRENRICVVSQGFSGNDKLLLFDGVTHAPKGTFDLGGVGGDSVYNPSSNRLYVHAAPKTRVFDGRDGSVIADIEARVIAVDAHRNQLYVGADASSVEILDGASHVRLSTLPISSNGTTGAVSPDGRHVYLLLSHQGRIAVIDTSSQRELARIAVSDGPYFIAFDEKKAYVCHNANPRTIGILAAGRFEQEIPEEFFDSFETRELDRAWTVHAPEGTSVLDGSILRLRPARASPHGPTHVARAFRGDRYALEVSARYALGETGGSRAFSAGLTIGSPSPRKAAAANSVTIRRSRDDWNGCCPGTVDVEFRERNRTVSSRRLSPKPEDRYVWRIRREGRTIAVEQSDDGMVFEPVAEHTFSAEADGVVQFLELRADSHAGNDVYADIDFVRLTRR